MQALLRAVRAESSAAIWSRGVELNRRGAVLGSHQDGDEIEVRIAPSAGKASPTVILFPGEVDWTCDCNTREPVCMHVAAAVIALNQGNVGAAARAAGIVLDSDEAARDGVPAGPKRPLVANVQYQFRREPDGLHLVRMLSTGRASRPLNTTLAAATASVQNGWQVAPKPLDLAVEVALGTPRRGPLPAPVLQRVLQLLIDTPEVRLGKAAIRVGPARPVLEAFLKRRGDGAIWLSLRQVRGIDEVFPNGAVRVGRILCATGECPLTPAELQRYRRGERIGTGDLAQFVTTTLPQLQARLPVDVGAVRLPRVVREAPLLSLEARAAGAFLTVLPTLVYGQPPCARVDGDTLHHLRGPVPLRDRMAEQQLAAALLDATGLRLGQRHSVQGADAVELAHHLGTWQGGVVTGDGVAAFAPKDTLAAVLEVRAGGSFDAHFASSPGGPTLGAGAVLAAWSRGEGYVGLTDGTYAQLPTGWLEQHGARLLALLDARGAKKDVPVTAWPELAALCAALDYPQPADLAGVAAALSNMDAVPEAVLPADLTVPLRIYQRRGVSWLQFCGGVGLGALLADDMGLGKTLQALCAVHGRTLVVAPTSVLGNWMTEAKRFRPQLRCHLYHGSGRTLDPTADVTLTSYALLRLDTGILATTDWDTVVLDEAQTIKNPESQVAQAAFALRAPRRIALSGTPVENSLQELWSQFHFLNPGLLGGRVAFETRFGSPIAQGDRAAGERLRRLLTPFMLRRRKSEVAPELPSRSEMILPCELSPEERGTYDAVRAATQAQVLRKVGASEGAMAALEALLRLRQACCHPALLPGQKAKTSAKVTCLLEALVQATAEGHRALVFSQWTGLLDLVEPHLREAHLAFNRLDGSTRDRQAVVDDFQRPDGPAVLLISLKAGGTGLNLTAADHVYILDPWWNPATEDQAADRAHRIGQERPVMIYRLVAQDTVEERILALQAHKRELAAAALHGGDTTATALGHAELMALLA